VACRGKRGGITGNGTRRSGKIRKLVKLKRLLDIDFTTKKYLRALDLESGYRLHHQT